MKYLIKITAIGMVLLMAQFVVAAQPKVGSLIYGAFGKTYTAGLSAKIIAVDGKQFTCIFSHSGSEYVFEQTDVESIVKVVSSKGGKFAAGSLFAYVEYRISEKTYECFLSKEIKGYVQVRFPDGKSFLGHIESFSESGGMKITFWHSWSTYSFDKDGKVTAQTGGAYPVGTQVKIFCVDAVYNFPPELKPPHLMEPKLNKKAN